ncbi:NosD domain-containing protein [Haloimpatiens sp. FM7330]|uniref:NosD domain-containing protein n=1 Tax=Haloimpatiens sp. FM7330 TaxID=3298610 RepID=UPI003640A6F3
MSSIEEIPAQNFEVDKKVMNQIGKQFEFKDLTINSSQTIKLFLNIVKNMIIMNIDNSNLEITETVISISGLSALTKYHMYEDNYHNHIEFITDNEGMYSFKLDLSKTHLIFIQTDTSTIYLTEDGWSDESIGSWNPETRLATIKEKVYDTIEIDVDNVIVDGNNNELIGSDYGNGIFINEKQNVTITRFKISHFTNAIFGQRCFNIQIKDNDINYNTNDGVYLFNCYYNDLRQNTISSNSNDGIWLSNCHYTKINDNGLNNNNDDGIWLADSHNIEIIDNKLNSNRYSSVWLTHCSNIKVESNITSNSVYYAIKLYFCIESAVLNNYILGNQYDGVEVYFSTNSKIQNNIIDNNRYSGIRFYSSNSNKVKNNKICNNRYGITLYYSCDNKILENRINSNINNGIYSYNECINNQIINNEIFDNNNGLYLVYSHYNKLERNDINNNSNYGIYISKCSFNKIYNNNFIKNFNHAGDFDGYNAFNIEKPYGGNYWDTWTEPDDNDDGFVDIPYKIEGGNEDKLPLTKPI